MKRIEAAVVESLRVHPRIVQQALATDTAARLRLFAALPALPPFGGKEPAKVVALLDWDHRLPSQKLFLRVHFLASDKSIARFERALAERLKEIRDRDLFPEFDLPDFADLPGDESYDIDLSIALGYEAVKLVSSWRRDVDARVGDKAVDAVRDSAEFASVRAKEGKRPPHLGDLEAVAWMPPCESGLAGWTVDVWWVTAFDGRVGRGWSFLVDNAAAVPVASYREFTIRAG